MRQVNHWIDGKETAGTSGRTADVFNPATGEVQAKVALARKLAVVLCSPQACAPPTSRRRRRALPESRP